MNNWIVGDVYNNWALFNGLFGHFTDVMSVCQQRKILTAGSHWSCQTEKSMQIDKNRIVSAWIMFLKWYLGWKGSAQWKFGGKRVFGSLENHEWHTWQFSAAEEKKSWSHDQLLGVNKTMLHVAVAKTDCIWEHGTKVYQVICVFMAEHVLFRWSAYTCEGLYFWLGLWVSKCYWPLPMILPPGSLLDKPLNSAQPSC